VQFPATLVAVAVALKFMMLARTQKKAGNRCPPSFDQVVGLALVEVKPVCVHHLGPGCDEVLHELLLGIILGVDLGICPQDRVRTENQIDPGRGPLGGAALAIAWDDVKLTLPISF